MERPALFFGILIVTVFSILPACSKQKEPPPASPAVQENQKTEQPVLPQNSVYLTNRLTPPLPKNLGFEEAPNASESGAKKDSKSALPVVTDD